MAIFRSCSWHGRRQHCGSWRAQSLLPSFCRRVGVFTFPWEYLLESCCLPWNSWNSKIKDGTPVQLTQAVFFQTGAIPDFYVKQGRHPLPALLLDAILVDPQVDIYLQNRPGLMSPPLNGDVWTPDPRVFQTQPKTVALRTAMLDTPYTWSFYTFAPNFRPRSPHFRSSKHICLLAPVSMCVIYWSEILITWKIHPVLQLVVTEFFCIDDLDLRQGSWSLDWRCMTQIGNGHNGVCGRSRGWSSKCRLVSSERSAGTILTGFGLIKSQWMGRAWILRNFFLYCPCESIDMNNEHMRSGKDYITCSSSMVKFLITTTVTSAVTSAITSAHYISLMRPRPKPKASTYA